MKPDQIRKLMETEHKLEDDPRRNYWHYRRAKATDRRDAIWQYANRRTDGEWETIETPSMDVLLRLEVPTTMKTCRDQGLTWQGFHDPDEYEAGY